MPVVTMVSFAALTMRSQVRRFLIAARKVAPAAPIAAASVGVNHPKTTSYHEDKQQQKLPAFLQRDKPFDKRHLIHGVDPSWA